MPLFALGSNSSYQLSLGHSNDVSSPSITTLDLPLNEHPVKIVAGSNHTLLLTNQGSLYATGANKYGQCMRPPCDTILVFVKIEDKWTDCAATWEGSVAIHEDGSLRTFGLIKNHKHLSGSKLINDGVEGVVGGVQHFVVLSGGTAVGYGEGRKGQLGASEGQSTPITFPYCNIIHAACGKDFTCLLSSSNEVKVETTSQKYGVNIIPTPYLTDIKSITASWFTIAILHNSGKITAWGRSDHGQYPPPSLPPISQLAAGSEHFIALSTEHKVYIWGWNEHGNCGRVDGKDVTTLHEVTFPAGERPTYVAAGCGTSWIWTTKID